MQSLVRKTIIILLLTVSNAHAQTPVVSLEDFKQLEGKWKGQLSYLDFSNNKQQTIRANAAVEIRSDNSFGLSIYYTDEPDHNATDFYEIREHGTMINTRKVIERTMQADGLLKIVTEEKGIDGNDPKPATFHFVLLIGKNSFTITKLVKLDGTDKYFERNQYVFGR